jgi:hypothetical protein
MIDKAEVEARFQKSLEITKEMEEEILRLDKAGISRDSLAFKAFEKEVHRASDEYIAAVEVRNALGTAAEEAVVRYHELYRRSIRLRDALDCLLDAGIAPGSPVHRLVDEEEDRLHSELERAARERDLAKAE